MRKEKLDFQNQRPSGSRSSLVTSKRVDKGRKDLPNIAILMDSTAFKAYKKKNMIRQKALRSRAVEVLVESTGR